MTLLGRQGRAPTADLEVTDLDVAYGRERTCGSERMPEAAMEARPTAGVRAFLSIDALAIRGGQESSGHLLWHQLDLQLAPNRARIPLERCQ